VSQENVEIVRRSAEAFIADGLEASLDYADPDIVVHPYPEWLEGSGALRGHDGLRYVTEWWTTQGFEDPHIEFVEIRDAGAKVVALYRQSALSVASGARVVQQTGAVCSGFREGRVGEVSFFLTWKQALEAAGLPE
jgi:ketosteroid isomerase-like protein